LNDEPSLPPSFQHQPSAIGPGSPPAPTISTHIACISCGYDLVGLSETTVCPECAQPVVRSLNQGLLGSLPTEHLQRFARGGALVEWGLVIFGVSIPLMLFQIEPARSTAAVVLRSAITMFGFLGVVLSAWGWWCLTSPKGEIWTGRLASRARLIRGATLVVLLAESVCTALKLGGLHAMPWLVTPIGVSWRFDVYGWAYYIGHIAAIVRYFASITLIREFAKLLPAPKLDSQAVNAGIAIPLLTVLGCPLLFIGPIIAWALYLGVVDSLRWHLRTLVRQNLVRSERLG
jgi:hypothetical protein